MQILNQKGIVFKVEWARIHTYCPEGKSFSFTTAQLVSDSSSVGHLAACIGCETGEETIKYKPIFAYKGKASKPLEIHKAQIGLASVNALGEHSRCMDKLLSLFSDFPDASIWHRCLYPKLCALVLYPSNLPAYLEKIPKNYLEKPARQVLSY